MECAMFNCEDLLKCLYKYDGIIYIALKPDCLHRNRICTISPMMTYRDVNVCLVTIEID